MSGKLRCWLAGRFLHVQEVMNCSYHLNAAEQEVLARKMEAFCQQQTGMNLHEYARQLRESGSQTPEMQM